MFVYNQKDIDIAKPSYLQSSGTGEFCNNVSHTLLGSMCLLQSFKETQKSLQNAEEKGIH